MSGDDAERHEAEEERREEIRRADPENKRLKQLFEKQLRERCLTLAIPAGKSLQIKSEELLEKACFKLRRPHPRSVQAELEGLPALTKVLYLKPNQIAHAVSEGTVALGITGNDVVREYSVYDARKDTHIDRLTVCAELPYSRRTSGPTTAVLFTSVNNPVNEVKEMAQNEEIATEYSMETARFLFQYGIKATLMQCGGGAEAFVVAGKCAYGVALIETGDTLRANGLKVIGSVFESNTVLIANKAALDIEEIRAQVEFVARKLKGVLAARERVYLLMNAPIGRLVEIKKCLWGFGAMLRAPTISPLLNASMFCSVATVVPTCYLNAVEMELMKLGAEGFVELDPSAIL